MRMKCHNKTSGRHQVVKTLIPLKVSVELILSPGNRGLQGYQGYRHHKQLRGEFSNKGIPHQPRPFQLRTEGNMRN